MKSWTIGGALTAALFSLTCCIGPAVFLITGVSVTFLGKLSVFAPFKNYFIAAGGLFIIGSVARTIYKKRRGYCSVNKRSSLISGVLTLTAAFLLVVSLFFDRIVLLFI